MTPTQFKDQVEKIVSAKHADPFSFLGMHRSAAERDLVVRAFLPEAQKAWVVHVKTGAVVAELPRVHKAGFFAGPLEDHDYPFPYRLRILTADETEIDLEDPYRFSPILNEMDVYFIAEGEHLRLDKKLGAHAMVVDGVHGVGFAVWAPNALRVSVVGGFNGWDGRRHPMRFRVECGVWEIFIPGILEGELYKFEIATRKGNYWPSSSIPSRFTASRRRAPPASSMS